MRPSLIAALLAALIGTPAAAEPLAVTVHPIKNFAIASTDQKFGRLEFLGGVEIGSSDRRFGGLSGIEVTDGGTRAWMASDDGNLVRAKLVHKDGRLVGLDAVEIDRLPVASEEDKDANDVEDFAFDPAHPDRGAVVLERRKPSLLTFTMKDGIPAAFEPVRVPADKRLLRSNKGLESVAFAPPASPVAGRIVVIAERARDRMGGTIPGWIIGAGEFSIHRHDDFDISSARFLPNGNLLLLERRYTPGWGVAMRLRQVPAASVEPGAKLDGETLVEAGMTYQIDNMEGLSVHQDETGRTILTLVSDDNKSILQRTLLLQFALGE